MAMADPILARRYVNWLTDSKIGTAFTTQITHVGRNQISLTVCSTAFDAPIARYDEMRVAIYARLGRSHRSRHSKSSRSHSWHVAGKGIVILRQSQDVVRVTILNEPKTP